MHARRPILHDGMDSTVQWSPCQGLEGQHYNTGVDSHGREYQHLYSDVDISQESFRRLKPSAEFRGLDSHRHKKYGLGSLRDRII